MGDDQKGAVQVFWKKWIVCLCRHTVCQFLIMQDGFSACRPTNETITLRLAAGEVDLSLNILEISDRQGGRVPIVETQRRWTLPLLAGQGNGLVDGHIHLGISRPAIKKPPGLHYLC